MKSIEFSKEERAEMVVRLQNYFQDELDQRIGSMAAEQFLEFLTKNLGAFYYNRGLGDAQAVFAKKLDDINDAIYALEQREARIR